MQYLLTEDEMGAIGAEREAARRMPNMEALVNVCQFIATRATGQIRPNSGHTLDAPHGCIHVADGRGKQHQIRYCDFCPVAGICPQPKEWSK